MKKRRNHYFPCSSVAVLPFLALWLLVFGPAAIETHLTKQLFKTEPLPAAMTANSQSKTLIYVLGGPQRGLNAKFKTVASLYNRKVAERILLFSNPGLTEYDPILRRNLTNNEWVIRQFDKVGVNNKDIEFVRLKKGFFGTLTEAEGISDFAIKRKYKQLILVTADHHTLRTWLSFSIFLRGKDIKLYLYGSNDDAPLSELLLEYMKLVFYKNVLLTIVSFKLNH